MGTVGTESRAVERVHPAAQFLSQLWHDEPPGKAARPKPVDEHHSHAPVSLLLQIQSGPLLRGRRTLNSHVLSTATLAFCLRFFTRKSTVRSCDWKLHQGKNPPPPLPPHTREL